jgi:hypothetical protein
MTRTRSREVSWARNELKRWAVEESGAAPARDVDVVTTVLYTMTLEARMRANPIDPR